MGFLRRVFGEQRPEVVVSISSPGIDDYDPADGLCSVTVGGVTLPGAIYRNYQRDAGDWTSGIRLEDPRTGRMLFHRSNYPKAFFDAGARSVAIVGIPHHPDAQRPEFGVGSIVRLVPEPTNEYDPAAIAFRSADGRYLAGYVSREDNPGLRATRPEPSVGVVVWEHHSFRPRVRKGLIALVGPSVALRVVSARDVPGEAALRGRRYAAGRREEEA